MRVKVDLNLEATFERNEDASYFYKAILPDFEDIDISLEGRSVVVNLSGLAPSRARALINSLLRMIQLYQRISELK